MTKIDEVVILCISGKIWLEIRYHQRWEYKQNIIRDHLSAGTLNQNKGFEVNYKPPALYVYIIYLLL